MKETNKIVFLTLTLLIVLSGCKKEAIPQPELPQITTTGKNSFGCYFNNEIFLPYSVGTSSLGAAYEKIYPNAYVAQIFANRHLPYCKTQSVVIIGDSLNLINGTTYKLGSVKKGQFYGYLRQRLDCSVLGVEYFTTDSGFGEIKLLAFNDTTQIVSGIFSFDAISSLGDTIKIRDGRFDLKFAK